MIDISPNIKSTKTDAKEDWKKIYTSHIFPSPGDLPNPGIEPTSLLSISIGIQHPKNKDGGIGLTIRRVWQALRILGCVDWQSSSPTQDQSAKTGRGDYFIYCTETNIESQGIKSKK